MKNIHLIKTDKPSRLFLNKVNNKLLLDSDTYSNLEKILPSSKYQHIYITDDSDIQEGDWFLQTTYEGVFKCSDAKIEYIYFDRDSYELIAYCKKIILTTDQELIEDGVQAIEDDFVKWFIKNPNCENVDIDKTLGCIDLDAVCNFGDNLPCPNSPSCLKNKYKIIIPKEELKQKTLENINIT